ncbi:TIGR02391 family protein [Cellulomonas soli]|uniref:Conserved hypothetical protein CHP02391 domain-containing protein n=1 Tax=Cellulomonas soli TaxID=931535 RepID=A0A512PDS5_9CELL|nr:TIGR02391 family protein [Cellulomonas soli]NYI59144.1 hypothetical protein [Cellulomonas soli]GEP69364.1 hypothetical protein CSO01_20790 [Cellulomonas soli]
MKAESSPEYLRSVLSAVRTFRSELEYFLTLHVVNETIARGIAPAIFARDGVDQATIDLSAARVSEAAGRASEATGLTNCYVSVQGAGSVDPIAAWLSMTQPKPVLESGDVVGAANQMVGRLEAMIARAEAEEPPTTGVAAMHPLVWGAASRLWRDGHYREAVATAGEALADNVKAVTGRRDVADTALWQEVFSDRAAAPGRPRLRWPGDPADRDVKNMTDGLRQFAPGAQMVIRNPAAHSTSPISAQEGLERLAALSLLARWVDDCDLVVEAGEVSTPGPMPGSRT